MILNQQDFEHGPQLVPALVKLIEANKSDLNSDLIGDLSHLHHRAECISGIEVSDVQYLRSNEYLLCYTYTWQIYNGCADLNDEGEVEGSVEFTVENDGTLVFETYEYDERSTYEEF